MVSRGSFCKLIAAIGAAALVAVLSLPAAGNAATPTLYETVGGDPALDPSTSLYRVDPTSGATTVVGDTGQKFTALAVDPTDGQLYGVSNNKSANPRALYRIDPATGGVGVVGPLGLTRPTPDMDFDQGGNLYGWSEPNDDLARINKVTGAATEIADSGVGAFGDGMSFDRAGTLFAALDGDSGTFYTVDPNSGAATPGPTLSGTNGYPVSAASFDCTGTRLYATIQNEGDPPSDLYTIDQTTGALTKIGPTQEAADGLVWYCPADISTTAVAAKASDGKVSIPITADGYTKGPVSADYTTNNGSAAAGRDYTGVSGTAVFAPYTASAQQTIDVALTIPPTVGEVRSFTLDLSKASGTGSIINGQATVTVTPYEPVLKVKKKGKKQKKGKRPRRPKYALKSNQPASTFECKVDRKRFKPCKSPFKTPMANKAGKKGKHKLKVRATNPAGLSSDTVKKKYRLKTKKKNKNKR